MTNIRDFFIQCACFTLGLSAIFPAMATPMDPAVVGVPFTVPTELRGYTLLLDKDEPDKVYIAPREGRLGEVNGMPQIGFAKTERDGVTYGIVNATFDFSVDADAYNALLKHIAKQPPYKESWKIQSVPFAQTTPNVAIAGFEEGDLCMEVIDVITGNKVKQCHSLVHRKLVSKNGPTLGEKIAISMVLTPLGADLLGKLSRTGAGLAVKLDAVYWAAHPAYTAKIDVDYKKVYESYEWFMGYHDGVCVEVAISEFFERESLCGENGKNANGRDCSVRITYIDNRGQEVRNLFAYIPGPDAPEEHKRFYKENKSKIEIFHSAVEGLQKKFEQEMLTPIQGKKASVSKDISQGFVLRANRTKSEIEKHFTIERKTIGGVIAKQTEIPAASMCIILDGDVGSVKKNHEDECAGYWAGKKRPAQTLPTIPGLGKLHTTKSLDYPVYQ